MTDTTEEKPARRPRRMAREPQQTDSILPVGENAGEGNGEGAGSAAKPQTKASRFLEMLKRPEGATLAELMEATEWQAHTCRSALTGLRKKSHAIVRFGRNDVTCYRIAGGAA